MNFFHASLICSSILLVACSATPPDSYKTLTQELDQLKQNQTVVKYAPAALKEAEEQVQEAESAWKSEDNEAYKHEEYIAKRYLEIARKEAELGDVEQQLSMAESERDDLVIQAREMDLKRAKSKTEQAEETIATLREKMKNIQAEQTDRGLVLTLRDVLFAFNESELQPGGKRTIQTIAEYLRSHPKTKVTVEGFTDSVGDKDYNKMLSEQRAKAVVTELERSGIDSSRINMEAYGEKYPVASNDSKAGRQQNRRVQMVLSSSGEKYKQPSSTKPQQ